MFQIKFRLFRSLIFWYRDSLLIFLLNVFGLFLNLTILIVLLDSNNVYNTLGMNVGKF